MKTGLGPLNPYLDGPYMGFHEVPPSLSLDQRMRLIEIAHETTDARVREEALGMLRASRMMVAVERT